MVHGWRPYSATNQPISEAIHGSGMNHNAQRSSQRFSWKVFLAEYQNDSANSSEEGEAQRDHDAEGPEHRRDPGDRVARRLARSFPASPGDVGGVLLQQQAVAEIGLVLFEAGFGRIVGGLGAQAARAP